MLVSFDKMQGLGNDFVFIDETQLGSRKFSAEEFRFISNRKLGVGCDTVVLYRLESNSVNTKFFNSDGSEAEICGNACRCFGVLLSQRFNWNHFNIKSANKDYEVDVCREKVCVNMRTPSFVIGKIGISDKRIDPMNILSALDFNEDEQKLFADACTVSVGNPHLILLCKKELSKDIIEKIGARLEPYPLFANRMNVSFVQILDHERIKLIVFERGVGVTLACGSGAAASAFVAYKKHWVQSNKITVEQSGGELLITMNDDGTVQQFGEARYVFKGDFEI